MENTQNTKIQDQKIPKILNSALPKEPKILIIPIKNDYYFSMLFLIYIFAYQSLISKT